MPGQGKKKQKSHHEQHKREKINKRNQEKLQKELDFKGQKIEQVTNGIGKRIETDDAAKLD